MMFAHGPWWSEWHHLIPFLPAIAAFVAPWWGFWRRKKRKDDE